MYRGFGIGAPATRWSVFVKFSGKMIGRQTLLDVGAQSPR
jgi:hypothetical protein